MINKKTKISNIGQSQQTTQFNKQDYLLQIQEIKLLQGLPQGQQVILYVRGQENQILKEIKMAKNIYKYIYVRMNTPSPEVSLSLCSDNSTSGNKYDHMIGSSVLSIKNNVACIYSQKNNKIGCSIKYQINQKNLNHFEHDTVIFDQPSQGYIGNIKKNKKKFYPHESYEKNAYYRPQTRIVEETQQQQSQDQLNFQEELDYFDRRQIKKRVAEASRILQQSLKHTEDERKMFSRYLDQSTSFLKQLTGSMQIKSTIDLNKSETDKMLLDMLTIKEQQCQQQLNTKQKWYKRRFKKNIMKTKNDQKKPKLLKLLSSQKQLQQNVKLTFFKNDSYQGNTLKKQISQIIICTNNHQKPNQINLFILDKKQKKLNKIVNLKKQDSKTSSVWPAQIILDCQYTPIHVSCIVEEKKSQYVGIIGSQQQKFGQCQLFNKNGQNVGFMYFKFKKICQSIVQTQDLILEKVQPSPPNSNYLKKQKKIDLLNQQGPHIKSNRSQTQTALKNTKQTMQQDYLNSIIKQKVKHQKWKNKFNQAKNETSSKPTYFNKLQQRQTESPALMRAKTMPSQDQNFDISIYKQNQEQEGMNFYRNKKKSQISNYRNSHRRQQSQIQATQDSKSNINLFPKLKDGGGVYLNIKITYLQLRMNKPNIDGKFLKVYINHENPVPYFTQTSRQMFFLSWKSKRFIFVNVPISCRLLIELMQSNNQAPELAGYCNIPVTQLKSQSLGLTQYQDTIKDKNQEILGNLVFHYELFEKNKNHILGLVLQKNKRRLRNDTQISFNADYTKKSINRFSSNDLKTEKNSLKSSNLSQSKIQRKYQSSRNYQGSQDMNLKMKYIKSLEQNHKVTQSRLSIRKYTGGNIIIPKAQRFKGESGQQSKNPGPGQYDKISQFQRHAIPL